ncbi:unnamed protein product [Mycena citricolor]|uniref:Uncharacterized protein n=1 Tax=Mycena citricolor TaxID=2018698 RepID=A0AAD2GZY0_9AGAR|nr:unnamed protein product [Mycena citricolor]
MIGLEANQEKIIMFWRSLTNDIRKEMFRARLHPEQSTWEEVTAGAEEAEVIVNLDNEDDLTETQGVETKKDTLNSKDKHSNRGRILSVSSANVLENENK